MGHQHHVVSTSKNPPARGESCIFQRAATSTDIFKKKNTRRNRKWREGYMYVVHGFRYTLRDPSHTQGCKVSHIQYRPRRVNRHVVSHTVHARQSVSGHWSERQRGATDTRASACVCGTGRVGRLEGVTYADHGVPLRHLGLCWPAACLQVRLRVRSGRHKRARRASGRRLLRGQQLFSPQLGLLARARFGGYLRGGG